MLTGTNVFSSFLELKYKVTTGIKSALYLDLILITLLLVDEKIFDCITISVTFFNCSDICRFNGSKYLKTQIVHTAILCIYLQVKETKIKTENVMYMFQGQRLDQG